MLCKIFLIYLLLLLMLLVEQTNVSLLAQTGKVKFNETFTLKHGGTIETEDAKLRIRLKGVGRTISESGETEYAELQIWSNKSERTIVISERDNRTKSVGNYIIKLIKAESFGAAHCQLKISRKR